MEAASLGDSGLWLMFLMGLRHGFDPDHIAIIDSMTYRVFAQRPRVAAWIGTLFALGHGLAVTAIAVALGAYTSTIALPQSGRAILDWLPTALMIMVGSMNLRDLLSRRDYQPRGWKARLLPGRVRDSSHPLAIVLVGVMFALVFDTATQAAAWGYSAASGGGAHMALLAGLAFTAGMVVTDTLDGQFVARLLRRASAIGDTARYRRRIGWVVVILSYAMAAYEIATRLRPRAELGEFWMTATGCMLVAVALLAQVAARRRTGVALAPTRSEP
jgi:high-affinity nickel-transport protein